MPNALGEWRPTWALLPDLATLNRLSQPDGGMGAWQQRLFDVTPDDSRAARLARLTQGKGGQNGGDKP
jgi:hypothetical protein